MEKSPQRNWLTLQIKAWIYCLLIIWTLESKGENVDYTSKNAFTVTKVWISIEIEGIFSQN